MEADVLRFSCHMMLSMALVLTTFSASAQINPFREDALQGTQVVLRMFALSVVYLTTDAMTFISSTRRPPVRQRNASS